MVKIKFIGTLLLTFISLNAIFSQGNVGINTNNPQAALHVADSNVVFTGNTLSAIRNPPISGAGIRMMWYPKKAAFRVGSVSGSAWDRLNTGYYSFATGRNTIALGDYSSAFGESTDATGLHSFASGFNTTASGSKSTAIGDNTTASGLYSFAANRLTDATGSHSTAIGDNTTASGLASFSQGKTTIASGIFSSSFGHGTEARGYGSTVVGYYNDPILSTAETELTPTTPLFVIGNGEAVVGQYKNAMTVLKNGNIGINTSSPQHYLHVVNNNAGDGGWAQGVVIENTSPLATVGEAAISFKNAALDSDKRWTVGVNQTSTGLAFNHGSSFASGNTLMNIGTNGRVGIGTINPRATLDVRGGMAINIRVYSSTAWLFPSAFDHTIYFKDADPSNPEVLTVQLADPSTEDVKGQILILINKSALPVNIYPTIISLYHDNGFMEIPSNQKITVQCTGTEWVQID